MWDFVVNNMEECPLRVGNAKRDCSDVPKLALKPTRGT